MENVTFVIRSEGSENLPLRWEKLKTSLIELDFRVSKAGCKNKEIFIHIDFNVDHDYAYLNPSTDKLNILILAEPKSVNPRLYAKSIIRKFDYVLTFSKNIAEIYNIDYVRFPAPIRNFENFDLKTKSLGLINSNKNSFIKESQYSLRRDVLKEAEKRNQSILLAGPGWELSTLSNIREDFNLLSDCLKSKNTPSFRNFRFPKLNFDSVEYLGYLNDKNSFYKHVSVCICIENDKNHFTEKLFDCIQAGVLPLYVGPKLSRHEIPDELAIECDHDAKSILDTYSSLSLNEILEFKLHASDWVKSAFTDWHEDTVMNIIAFKIKNFIDSRNFS